MGRLSGLAGIVAAISIVMLLTPGLRAEEGRAGSGPEVQAQTQKQDESGLKKDYEVYDLGELYVKGEKLPTTMEATDLYVVTAEDIEATHSLSVADALKYVPGITVTTGRKNSPNVQIHGLNQARTLVLIDGVPYYETTFGSLDLNSIPVDNVAKIEIQKGVSSVLYGPNGLAGIINIITKKPGVRPSLDARVETGDDQEYRFSASHGMKVGMLNYWFGYDHQQSKGYYLSDDYDPRVTALSYSPALKKGTVTPTYFQDKGVRDNSDFRTDSFWGKVGLEPTPTSEYYLNLHYITRDRGAPASILDGQNKIMTTFPAFSQLWRVPTYDNWGADLSGQQKVGDKVTLKGKLFYHDHVDDLKSYFYPDDTRPLSISRYKDYMVGGALLSDVELAKIDTLRLSLNYRKDDHKERADKSLPFQNEDSYTGSFGVEDQFDPFKQLSITGGLAYDWWEVTNAEINSVTSSGVFTGQTSQRTPDSDQLDPMAGVTYTFSDNTKLYGSWARKIRFPTLSNLYSSNGGNPDLKPEKSQNYILGASRPITQYARGEFNLFAYDINDFITKDTPDRTAPFRNAQSVFMYGVEAIGEVFPMKDLSFRLGYTYTNAADRSPGAPTERVTYVPTHKVDLSGKYLIPVINVQTDLTALYVGRIWDQLPSLSSPTQAALRTGDYFIVDARISKVFANHVELYFVAHNIFDKNYEEEIGFPAPGRNLFVGVRYSY